MFPIRMQKRACTDNAKIQRFLDLAKTGFLGLSSDDVPYVVPLNFLWRDGAVYFHGAAEGRKVSVMERNTRACFTVSEEYGTIADPVPANTDTAYMSVIIDGTVEPVTDLSEATEAMQGMLDKYVPGYYDKPLARIHVEKYVSSMGSRTAVFKLVSSSVSAKEKEVDPAHMFYPGRTIRGDK
ncbi:pyridoxamine 5'-phosphate oxidase family protein [Cohnella sp. CFH 77786]|uniref:pyridoxamine 5'-phosphate oxidase family protein n=1 Tax=Cohnella sp. CFH 77786 TaxID=2662265 RepID=UPI001C60A60D|nr:pyridoxamine 5'-phosphate oxidase family protein [Cohnella sp. CFH 77786]MBW5446076.1 pyridoxamine 5'-phosphate oxidase family protein [Cohnella sp. CFH 77786]